ncbi:hypothetical protein ACF8FF_07375 [Pseudomonas sp. zjy_13]|uniref:hypothetical protein n=1 Tax=Pseudomonas sp. zjy_13 TaxID=3367263 RepID=UPI00370C7E3D
MDVSSKAQGLQKARIKPVLLIVVVAAVLVGVSVAVAKKMVDSANPVTADEIKAAVGDSICKKRIVQVMTDRGEIVTRADLEKMQYPCQINDEQRAAVAN